MDPSKLTAIALKSPSQLKQWGVPATSAVEIAVAVGITFRELVEAGYSLKELHSAGLEAKLLVEEGFTTSELINAGYNPLHIMHLDCI